MIEKKFEFAPKNSLFGKLTYFEEQVDFSKFVDRIAKATFGINPGKYILQAMQGGKWPMEKIIRRGFGYEDERLRFAKRSAIEAKSQLQEMGV